MTPEFVGVTDLSQCSGISKRVGFVLDCKCKEVLVFFFLRLNHFRLNIISTSTNTITIILHLYELVSRCLILNVYHFILNITGEGKKHEELLCTVGWF